MSLHDSPNSPVHSFWQPVIELIGEKTRESYDVTQEPDPFVLQNLARNIGYKSEDVRVALAAHIAGHEHTSDAIIADMVRALIGYIPPEQQGTFLLTMLHASDAGWDVLEAIDRTTGYIEDDDLRELVEAGVIDTSPGELIGMLRQHGVTEFRTEQRPTRSKIDFGFDK